MVHQSSIEAAVNAVLDSKVNELHDEEVNAVLEEKEENASITKSIHNSILDGK